MARPKNVEGVYSATEIIDKLVVLNGLEGAIENWSVNFKKKCVPRVTEILSNLNPNQESTDSKTPSSRWVTDRSLYKVLSDEDLNICVIMKAKNISEKKAKVYWDKRNTKTGIEILSFFETLKKENEEVELPYIDHELSVSKKTFDDVVLKKMVEALYKSSYGNFDKSAFEDDVKLYLALKWNIDLQKRDREFFLRTDHQTEEYMQFDSDEELEAFINDPDAIARNEFFSEYLSKLEAVEKRLEDPNNYCHF